ncbi:hypothetical protein ACPRNU_05550 [Chromobacterium vaccinii]|uniref:hypothetical protein n=1 Tax=Chromobacterium vaccinii TaxID=1108595 RepID=UPI003C786BD2
MDTNIQYPTGDLPKGYTCGSIINMKHTIRRQRLQLLIDEHFKGNRGRFADFLGKQRPQIYRLFSEGENRRDIGEDMAREIEEKFGLKKFSLDQPLDSEDQTSGSNAEANLQALPPELQELVQDLYRAYLAKSLNSQLIDSLRTLTRGLNPALFNEKNKPVHSENLAIASRLAKRLDRSSEESPPSSPPTADKNGDLDAN